MGFTSVVVEISNPRRPKRVAKIDVVVDSGAFLSLIPAAVLRQIGIEPRSTEIFTLADGREIRRQTGEAMLRVGEHEATSPVVFGRRGDERLLGVLSLECLGLVLDAQRQRLIPMRRKRL